MIRIIDLENTGFMKNSRFKNKAELRNTLLGIAREKDLIDFRDLRVFDLNYLKWVFQIDIYTDERRLSQ